MVGDFCSGVEYRIECIGIVDVWITESDASGIRNRAALYQQFPFTFAVDRGKILLSSTENVGFVVY